MLVGGLISMVVMLVQITRKDFGIFKVGLPKGCLLRTGFIPKKIFDRAAKWL